MPDYLSQVASATGLAKQTLQGVVVGLRDGYLVCINPKPITSGKLAVAIVGKRPDAVLEAEKRSVSAGIQIVIRTGGITDPVQVKPSLQHSLSWGFRLSVEDVDANSVTVVWHYTFIRPSPEKVGAAVRNVLAALNPVADPCTKCDKCAATTTLNIFFSVLPEPLLLCSRCRQQLLDESAAYEARYARLPVHLGRAVILASVVSIGGAEIVAHAWYRTRSLSPFFWSTAVLGIVIGLITATGAGKVTRGVKVLAYLATASSVWIATFRSLALNDATHPLRSWEPGPLVLMGFVALWCTWLPLVLAGLAMFLGQAFFEHRSIEKEAGRAV